MKKLGRAAKKPGPQSLLAILVLALAACGGTASRFEIQFSCLHRSLAPCAAAEDFASRISDRTDGRVIIQFTSMSELDHHRPEAVPWEDDEVFRLMELHGDHLGPLVHIDNLLGVVQGLRGTAEVTEAVREDVERSIEEKTGGLVLAYLFYPRNYLYSTKPLRTVADMEGLKIRTYSPWGESSFNKLSHANVSRDLLNGMGAVPVSGAYSQVHQELSRGNVDAAVSCSACGSILKWYEVAGYLVGPIGDLSHSWLVMNQERWADLPPGIQAIVRDEARILEKTTNALNSWDQQGIEENIDGGMEYLEISADLKDAARQSALTNVLPGWVERIGGPIRKRPRYTMQKSRQS